MTGPAPRLYIDFDLTYTFTDNFMFIIINISGNGQTAYLLTKLIPSNFAKSQRRTVPSFEHEPKNPFAIEEF